MESSGSHVWDGLPHNFPHVRMCSNWAWRFLQNSACYDLVTLLSLIEHNEINKHVQYSDLLLQPRCVVLKCCILFWHPRSCVMLIKQLHLKGLLSELLLKVCKIKSKEVRVESGKWDKSLRRKAILHECQKCCLNAIWFHAQKRLQVWRGRKASPGRSDMRRMLSWLVAASNLECEMIVERSNWYFHQVCRCTSLFRHDGDQINFLWNDTVLYCLSAVKAGEAQTMDADYDGDAFVAVSSVCSLTGGKSNRGPEILV